MNNTIKAPITKLLEATTEVKPSKFFDRIKEYTDNKQTFTREQSNYLDKMTSISDGSLRTCLNQSEIIASRVNTSFTYDDLDAVRYTWKNFVINRKLKCFPDYKLWQDAWGAFAKSLENVVVDFPVASACDGCNSNLSEKESVTRTYVNKYNPDDDVIAIGHYSKDGNFESDSFVGFGFGTYDCRDDSDTCSHCGHQL